jgi:hypothetical protein
LDTFVWALTISWSHGSLLVCEVAPKTQKRKRKSGEIFGHYQVVIPMLPIPTGYMLTSLGFSPLNRAIFFKSIENDALLSCSLELHPITL